MKVKDLIKELMQMDQEASVVSQEYTGGDHSIHDIGEVIPHSKGDLIAGWDNSSHSDVVDEQGKCKRSVVYIN